MRRTGTECGSIRALLIQLLAEMQPEILARRMQLELDLDDVPFGSQPSSQPPTSGTRSGIVHAMRGLLADAIESTGYEGELTVTLVDADNCWELELATIRSGELVVPQLPGTKNSTLLNPPRFHTPAGNQESARTSTDPASAGPNFVLGSRAAVECGGQVELMRCPQGGVARILVMPKPRARRAA
jgi:hypothetical protein